MNNKLCDLLILSLTTLLLGFWLGCRVEHQRNQKDDFQKFLTTVGEQQKGCSHTAMKAVVYCFDNDGLLSGLSTPTYDNRPERLKKR